MKPSHAAWFYFGTLVSSIGSFAFNICLIAFMLRAGYDLFFVSLILGAQRLLPIAVAALYGHLTDRLPPRRTVICAELAAAAATLGILGAWSRGPEAYWFFATFCILKASIMSFQLGSRAKITKL